MPWTVTIDIDEDKLPAKKIGQVVAYWNRGLSDEFVFDRRIDFDVNGEKVSFIADAKAAKTRRDNRSTTINTVKAQMETALNS